MRKQIPMIEWQVLENDKDWNHLSLSLLAENKPNCSSANHIHCLSKHYYWEILAMLLLLVNLGGWWYATRQNAALSSATNACLLVTSPTALDTRPNDFTHDVEPNTVTDAELNANRQAYAEYRATVAGLGHFAEPYNSQAMPTQPPLTP